MKKGLWDFNFSLPVTVVVLAIVYIYISTVFVFIDRWFSLMTSPGIMNAVVFTGVAVACVYNYLNAIFTDPGLVPVSYMSDVEDLEHPIHEIKRKAAQALSRALWNDEFLQHTVATLLSEDSLITEKKRISFSTKKVFSLALKGVGGELRYCQKCSHYKPPRAHHCRVCKRCVLRMDHHCIWINNCVGHANYKVFFIFVVYTVISCIYSLVLLVGSLTNDTQKEEEQNGGSFRTTYVFCGLLLVPLSATLSVLLGWHIYLVLHNKTTIEYHEGVRAKWLAEKGGDIYNHPYDLGAFENLTDVLGPNIFCWLFPVSRHIGSGLHFRTAYDNSVPASAAL